MTKITDLPVTQNISTTSVFLVVDNNVAKQFSYSSLKQELGVAGGYAGSAGPIGFTGSIGSTGYWGSVGYSGSIGYTSRTG
jgi:hypothetical protein